MTEFDAIMGEMFSEAMEITGAEEFTFDGETYRGSVPEMVSEQRPLNDETGRMVDVHAVRILAPKAQFPEKPQLRKRGVVGGQDLRLDRVGEDSISYTLDFIEADS